MDSAAQVALFMYRGRTMAKPKRRSNEDEHELEMPQEIEKEASGVEGDVYTLPDFPNTIFITGPITDQSATDFYRCVHEMDFRAPIKMVLNSPGGELVPALAMIDLMEMIKDLGCPLITISCGEAYSAAALLLACGTPGERYMSPSSYGMVHDMQAFAFGNLTTDIRPRVKHLDELHEKYISVMARARLKLKPNEEPSEPTLLRSKDHVRKLFERGDLFLDAEAMIGEGFVDKAQLPLLKMPAGLVEMIEEATKIKPKTKPKAPRTKRTRKPKQTKETDSE